MVDPGGAGQNGEDAGKSLPDLTKKRSATGDDAEAVTSFYKILQKKAEIKDFSFE